MAFSAQDSLNLVMENNEIIFRNKEDEIYLEIIKYIKNASKQGNFYVEIPINYTSSEIKLSPIVSEKLVNKIMIFLRKRGFYCKIKIFSYFEHTMTFKKLYISW